MSSRVVALFARAPEFGQVKTRLARTRGDGFALEFYRAMLGDTLELVHRAQQETPFHPIVFATPAHSEWREWRGEVRDQGEGDLWTRLLRADARLREEGFERVVFIGSDAPDLPQSLLCAAFDCLEERPIVLGPALDGGFTLLGSARHLPDELFEQVPVSSGDTLARLTQNLRKLARNPGWDYSTLMAWRDVDDEADLGFLIERLRENPDSALRCRAVLKRCGLI